MPEQKKAKNSQSHSQTKSKEKSKKQSIKVKNLIAKLKRPLTPFISFCSKMRKEQKKNNECKKLTAKELGAMWSKISETQKKPFIDQYEEEKLKYDKLKNEIEAKYEKENSEEEKEEEDKEEINSSNVKKGSKAKIKIKKAIVDKKNAKACNCGKCTDCKKRKIKENDDDSDECENE